ncbi:hypothetical protein EJ04DRAFT_72784 [Polyplosphaeria fusca]|uniref:Uncharacterized protein n=1 Tax=Polyplosphaeria fusca TaxID=682080 RepID=A0A9P4R7L1_9PLEO|nr:hypothetical protein EJ04DRAFT_72784 [Polyplosphaeria fusca]
MNAFKPDLKSRHIYGLKYLYTATMMLIKLCGQITLRFLLVLFSRISHSCSGSKIKLTTKAKSKNYTHGGTGNRTFAGAATTRRHTTRPYHPSFLQES